MPLKKPEEPEVPLTKEVPEEVLAFASLVKYQAEKMHAEGAWCGDYRGCLTDIGILNETVEATVKQATQQHVLVDISVPITVKMKVNDAWYEMTAAEQKAAIKAEMDRLGGITVYDGKRYLASANWREMPFAQVDFASAKITDANLWEPKKCDGATLPEHYNWFYSNARRANRHIFEVNDGWAVPYDGYSLYSICGNYVDIKGSEPKPTKAQQKLCTNCRNQLPAASRGVSEGLYGQFIDTSKYVPPKKRVEAEQVSA